MRGIRLTQRLCRRRLDAEAKRALEAYADHARHRQESLAANLTKLSAGAPATVSIGRTKWRQEVRLPINKLAAHGLVLGASGAGKSYCAISIITQVLSNPSLLDSLSFGVLDAKGELFEKTLIYLHAYLHRMSAPTRKAIEKRIILINFSDSQTISPYNVLARRAGLADELMVADRLDTISEQFSGLSEMSVRMRMIAKYLFLLMAEFDLTLPFFEQLCADPLLLDALVRRTQNRQVRDYFQNRFDDESRSTLLALRQRIDSLLVSEGVRLSLSASSSPDFAALQDQGSIVLINTAGRNITRGISELLQGLILSDIKQSVFRRSNPARKFLWFFDEAQNLYKNSANREHMVDLLTMARSFGSFFVMLTQSLSSAIRDSDVLNAVMTNVRWIVMLRSTLRDAELITPAIPLTGTLLKADRHHLEPAKRMSANEELKANLKEITRLPDRQAYCWLKAYLHTAVKITTPHMPSPLEIAGCTAEEFDAFVRSQRIGQGMTKEAVRKEIERNQERLREILHPQRVYTSVAEQKKGRPILTSTLEEIYAKKK